MPLCESFPHLFSLTLSQDVSVGEVCGLNLVGERWRFLWRRELFEWEKERFIGLLGRSEGVVLRNRPDIWV